MQICEKSTHYDWFHMHKVNTFNNINKRVINFSTSIVAG